MAQQDIRYYLNGLLLLVEDQRLITGQNPASGGAVADLLIEALKE